MTLRYNKECDECVRRMLLRMKQLGTGCGKCKNTRRIAVVLVVELKFCNDKAGHLVIIPNLGLIVSALPINNSGNDMEIRSTTGTPG